MRREHRRQQSNQLRKNKRDDVIAKKRCLGTAGNAPFLVCVVPLNASIDPKSALYMLEKCDADAQVNKTASGVTYISLPRFKQRFTFVVPPVGRGLELTTLDYLKVCDTTLFLLSANVNSESEDDILDRWGNRIYNMAMSQGIPTPIFALQDLESIAPKRRQPTKAAIQKFIEHMMPDEKLMMLDTDSDALNMLRKIGAGKKNIQYNRMNRPHLFSEQVEYADGTLKLTGFLRGVGLDVNQLVHIPGLGDFQLEQIDGPADPYPIEKRRTAAEAAMDDGSAVAGGSSATVPILAKADPSLQTALDRENIPDEMDQEQPFPTEEEIAAAQLENQNRKKLIKRVPKGTSSYQACWIPDVEEVSGEDDDSEEEEDEEEAFMSCESDKESVHEAEETMSQVDEGVDEEYDEVALEDGPEAADQRYDQELDMHEDIDTMQKIKAAKSDQQWPDELDTPLDQLASVRFQKYRGLEAFRTSPWDVKENLPRDYARIFQFKNFDRTKRRIIALAKDEVENEGVEPGTYVTVHVKNVDEKLWSVFQSGRQAEGLILYGMLPHEQQMSVQNCVLKRTHDSELPLQSKERMIVQCGYRRFIVNPIFSQHTNGDKHKFERFFRPGETVVATYYAPIQFPPAPVLCFRENPDTSLTMVANGVLMSCNPDRVVLKRVVISGHPFKINRKVATIRYMFFNKEDIDYFKPIKLRTKCGRVGHIRESLGTHGHMKCVFDMQLKSYDTVMMYLYKRVFPKWTYQDCIVADKGVGEGENAAADEQMKE